MPSRVRPVPPAPARRADRLALAQQHVGRRRMVGTARVLDRDDVARRGPRPGRRPPRPAGSARRSAGDQRGRAGAAPRLRDPAQVEQRAARHLDDAAAARRTPADRAGPAPAPDWSPCPAPARRARPRSPTRSARAPTSGANSPSVSRVNRSQAASSSTVSGDCLDRDAGAAVEARQLAGGTEPRPALLVALDRGRDLLATPAAGRRRGTAARSCPSRATRRRALGHGRPCSALDRERADRARVADVGRRAPLRARRSARARSRCRRARSPRDPRRRTRRSRCRRRGRRSRRTVMGGHLSWSDGGREQLAGLAEAGRGVQEQRPR